MADNLRDAPATDRRQPALAAATAGREKENVVRGRSAGKFFQDRPQRRKKIFLIEPQFAYLYRKSFSSMRKISPMRFLADSIDLTRERAA
jgi:hypothetical protein